MKKIFALFIATILFISSSMSVFGTEANTTQDKEIQRIVSGVINQDPNISFDEMLRAMEKDEEAAKTLIRYFNTTTKPIEPPTYSNSNQDFQQGRSTQSHFTVEYNLATKEEKTIFEDELFLDPLVHETEYCDEGLNLPFTMSSPLSRSYADWDESSPESYSDTRTIFKLFIFAPGKTSPLGDASAFKISSNYLATCGHCVYDWNGESWGGGWAGNILCVPAYTIDTNGYEYFPYGATYQVTTNMACGGNWKNGYINDDWGILQMKNPINPINTGYLSRRLIDRDITGETVRIAGYPGGKKNMHLSWGYVKLCRSNSSPDYRIIDTDATGIKGQSGCPVTDINGRVVGIYRGRWPGEEPRTTMFVKLDTWLFNKLNSYS